MIKQTLVRTVVGKMWKRAEEKIDARKNAAEETKKIYGMRNEEDEIAYDVVSGILYHSSVMILIALFGMAVS